MARIVQIATLADGRLVVLHDDGRIFRQVDHKTARAFQWLDLPGLPEDARLVEISTDAAGNLAGRDHRGRLYTTARAHSYEELCWREVDMQGLPP